jgi:iron complex transport system permease protein
VKPPASEARRILLLLLPHLGILVLAAIVTPLFGPQIISPARFVEALLSPGTDALSQIVISSRLPRLVLAAVAGSGLAVSGVTLQSVLKNPLASPFTLGVASGGSFGVAIAIVLGLDFALLGMGAVQLTAVIGAVATMLVIFAIARALGFTSMSLILAGVTVNLTASAGIMLVQSLSDMAQSHIIIHWLMGGLDLWGSRGLGFVSAVVAAGITGSLLLSPSLNHIMLGEELAAGRGIPVRRVLLAVLVLSSAMTGAVVSIAGPVAFVGLIVPHAARLVGVPDNRYLVPASAMSGATVLMVCDAFARTAFAPVEMPVGIVTSILGGVTFIVLLFARQR